jgi:hypothetical protein
MGKPVYERVPTARRGAGRPAQALPFAAVRTPALIAAALALLVAGCGGATDSSAQFEGEQRAVAEVVEDLQEASVDDDAERICTEILARELRERAGDCPRAIGEALEDADTYDLEVTKVEPATITAGTTEATATVESGRDGDQVERITLVRESRQWRISQLAGR